MHGKALKITVVILLILIVALLIVFPVSLGRLPAPKTSKGLSEKIKLDTGKGELGLMLLSEDTSNPVLLICGGGPGIPEYLLEYLYPSVLPSEFTVCYWDYRGVCSSFDSALPAEEMDTEQFIEDTVFLTDYLRDRFKSEKIYIMGHSFGSYVALNTVARYPGKYVCYIAMSQAVDTKRSETEAFEYMRQRYIDLGNDKMVKEFDSYDIMNSEEDLKRYRSSSLRDGAMHELGVGTARNMGNVITGIFFPSLRCTAYTQKERIDLWRGKAASKDFAVHDETESFNSIEEIPSLDLPVVFIAGKYDMTCCTGLQEEYYNKLEAPYKRIFIFDESAHSPLYEEADTARRVLEEIKEA